MLRMITATLWQRVSRLPIKSLFVTSSQKRSRLIASWLFPLPAVLVVLVMMAYPVGYTVWLSLHDLSPFNLNDPEWVGTENYSGLLDDTRFHAALKRTVSFTAGAVTLQLLLGVGMALLFNHDFKGRGLVRTLFLLPMVATPVAMSLIWLLILNPVDGVANWALKLVGFSPQLWLNSADTVIPTLVLMDTWQWSPLIMLMVLAGMSVLPLEPFEAAAIDGASRWQSFRLIMLPLLRPTIMVALLFRSIDCLKTFDIIYGTTQGGPGFASETLNLYIYKTSFDYFRLGYAAAALVVFFTIVLGVSLLLIVLRRRAEAGL
ncbi:MAG: sugar ABC transporter permease [Chloroflexota bacterium]